MGRAIWLIVVAPPTGLTLRARPRPGARRWRPLLFAAALAWLWCGAIVLVTVTGLLFHATQAIGETAIWSLLWAFPALVPASFVAIVTAMLRPGWCAEGTTFANSAFLLFVAFGFDMASTPST